MKDLKKECGRKKLLGTVAFLLAALLMYAGPSQAQDEGKKGLSGFYVGALVGYATGEYSSDISSDIDHKPNGALLGIQGGWSHPYGPIIFGIDGDIAYTWIKGDDEITTMGYRSDVKHDINCLGTIRPRLGVMAGPALIYGTAGLAFANLDNKLVVSYNGQRVGSDEKNSWHIGWTAGGGVEYPINSRISLRAEYLYIDMGKEEITMNIGGYPITDKGDLNLHTIRLSIQYRF
jgi:outer membrane immunogenic protein